MTDKWDLRFLDRADLMAAKSLDPNRKVGAVIVDKDGVLVSEDYNRFPYGVSDDPDIWGDREEKNRRVLHAEAAAIMSSIPDMRGHTMYITHAPCGQCAALIIESGISRVVYRKTETTRWEAEVKSGDDMFREAGVEIIKV